MKRLIHTAALLLPLAGTGCQGPRMAGTTTETENAVAARWFPVDSILPGGSAPRDQAVVATLRLDRSGLDFSGSRGDGQDLDVVAADGRAVPFEIVYWDPANSRGRLRVRIDPWLRSSGSRILLRKGLSPAARSSAAAVWSGVSTPNRLAWNSVLVDDFEANNLLHNRLPDSSFWFLGGLIPASGSAPAGSGRSGTSLHLTCGPGQCDTAKTLLAATLLANTPRGFRSLDSVELWARGNGKLWITLESLDSTQMGRMSRGHIDSIQPRRTWTTRTLDTSWQRFSIAPSDFDKADGVAGNLGWSGVSDSINYLTFLVEGGTEVWIDDLRLHGVLPDDLR